MVKYMKPSKGEKVFDIFNMIFLTILGILFLYPIINVVAVSFSSSSAVLQNQVTVFPVQFTTTAYSKIINNASIYHSYENTIFVALIGCVLTLLATCIAAYPLAFCEFYGKKVYSMMIIIALWFSGGMIPTYLVMNSLHLTNSLWALILNTLFSSYYIIILRSFFTGSIPMSLIESMRMDGANDFTILFRLVIPLSKAALATIALWIIVLHWNEFLPALMYLQDRKKYTLQMILQEIILQNQGALSGASDSARINAEGQMVIPTQIQNAVIVVSIIPMIVIYPFLSKYFVKGIMLGAVKG
jgi:putative aldouronate transport system permease protein